MPRPIPAGSRFGRLVVVIDRQPGERLATVRCDCGTERQVDFRLLGTSTRSCGCFRVEVTTQRSTRHGHAGTPIYMSWADMVARCTRTTHPRYHDYGGRGITICERWRDFANFLADMGERPEGMTLDRINNDGGYEPDNCRWADWSTQARNRRPSAYAGSVRDAVTGRFISKAREAA